MNAIDEMVSQTRLLDRNPKYGLHKIAKEWILNSATNRFQLNFKRNVGAVSEAIRKCSPKNLGEWKKYYFKNVKSKEHIEKLGKKLYVKITEVISSEVENIT